VRYFLQYVDFFYIERSETILNKHNLSGRWNLSLVFRMIPFPLIFGVFCFAFSTLISYNPDFMVVETIEGPRC